MPVELPELTVSSKSPGVTPQMIADVFEANGFTPPVIEEATVQPTPAEVEAAEEATATAEAAAEATRVAAEAEAEETERKSRNQKRREAREKLENDLRTANERAEKLERDMQEMRQAQTTTAAQIEDLKKNPPKAEPAPEAPKKPSRIDFVDADDPDEAYDDAKYNWRRDMEKFEREEAERATTKAEPAAAKPAATAAPATTAATFSDAELQGADLTKIEDLYMRRFLKSALDITEKHPGTYKAIVENVPNVNDAMVQAGHLFDEPARIALYLAQHPEDSKRIKALTDGDVKSDPRKIRAAQKELEKIEQLAAEEDAAEPAGGSGTTPATGDEVNPDDDSVATQPTQPHTPPAQTTPPQATPAQPPQQKKPTPIEPVGARGGTQTEKSYAEMTAEEQKVLWNSPGGPEKIRKMKGLL